MTKWLVKEKSSSCGAQFSAMIRLEASKLAKLMTTLELAFHFFSEKQPKMKKKSHFHSHIDYYVPFLSKFDIHYMSPSPKSAVENCEIQKPSKKRKVKRATET